MKIRNYMKKYENTDSNYDLKQVLSDLSDSAVKHSKSLPGLLFIGGVILFSAVFILNHNIKIADFENLGDIKFTDTTIAVSSSQRSVITIPSGMVKANPFVPYRDLGVKSGRSDVPASALIEPPEFVNDNSEAARVMDTIVSGILFDKFSPSAIINIEGNDYLVKKGDAINNYKVLNITPDSVSVQFGKNTYKAGIGEILTEGSLNHNEVSNLKNKFGGEK